MFFANFWAWLNAQLLAYVGANTAIVAATIEPVAVILGTLYVMMWGYLQMQGRIQEPVMEGARRILVLAIIFGVALRLWLYNAVLVDTFYNAPAQLAAAIAGAAAPIALIDQIWQDGGAAAGLLWSNGALLSSDLGFYIAGAFVWVLVGLLCVYALFLISLSKIALAILLALGPLFIVLLLFDSTKRFFEAWLAQLANYALITILTILVAALLLQVVRNFAQQTAALGAGIRTVDALNLLLVSGLVLLVMRQVMPIAASLASGVSLTGFNVVSRSVAGLLGSTQRTAYLMGRGAMDRETSRFDPLRRKLGFALGQGARQTGRAAWRAARPGNTVRRS